MESKNQKKLRKVSNVQKNFIYQCQICYEDYDTLKHVPMIVCSNYHAICAQCVKSNLFKKQYNAQKNPTGRYMCSKCSQIIQKQDIREHTILKEVSTYISKIRQKDEQLRNDFYNHIGTMGMNLVAMREDYDAIEKNNLMLKKENQLLIKENCRLRDDFLKIQNIKGSLEELERLAKQVEDTKETLELENVKLQSLKDQIKRNYEQIHQKKKEILAQKQQFFALQRDLTQLRQDLKLASKKNKQLLEQNQGSINLKEYLQQEINSLQNQKKSILEQSNQKKRRVNESIKKMQTYWEDILKNEDNFLEQINLNIFEKESKMYKQQKKDLKFEMETKLNVNVNEQNKCKFFPFQKQQKQQVQKVNQQLINLFDRSERSIRNFFINDSIVTLTNDKLFSFTHISFQEGFKTCKDSTFTIKIHKLQDKQIMIGLMTEECKNKKNIYERKGFYGIDGFQKSWNDGECDKSSVYIRQGDKITVKYSVYTQSISFSRGGKKDPFVMKPTQNIKNKVLYPVVLLITESDSFEIVQVK